MTKHADLLAAYPPARDRFDELFEAPLRPRAHWSTMIARMASVGARQIGERLQSAERQIREHGITYNVYADPQGLDRPWELDVLPLLIPQQEWHEIEVAIAQRARLLNLILADLYGPQTLMREGCVPPELVFGHGGFVRAAHGARLASGMHLHVYAADLARAPDGRWWVLADRTQAPSGAGYALENRLIVSRVFPELYRDLRVEHLAAFFATLRDALAHYAPRDDGPVRTVLLTPGPYNETYFEHAMLARYLGFPLVEGGDLTVRDGRVWLKTLDGLQRVHAILRRLDDGYCDPLELRPDSALGVPGLTDCMRTGSVLIANALGSGVLESGAMLGFLPALAQRLLGEPLKMPSVGTWWCGERAAREDAFARMDALVFKPADPAHPFEPVFGQDLDADAARALRRRVMRHPGRYIAQELVRLSQAPVLTGAARGGVGARAIGMRVFAVATPGGYVVMPGGLTRVAASNEARVVSMQRGGASKDTWVLSQRPVNASFSLLRSTVSAGELVRAGAALPTRIAENLFWFGRYAERCDDAARLLRLTLSYRLTAADEDRVATDALVALSRRFGLLQPDDEDIDAGLLASASLERRALGLAGNLRQLARVAFTLRDRLSMDNWRTLNGLTQDPAFDRPLSLIDALAWLDRAIAGVMTLSGFALDGMTRDAGWRLLSIGRRVERLAFTCLALQTAVDEGRAAGLGWLLELADSIITYRARYTSAPEWLPVLDLLVLDRANPRSVLYQASGIADFLQRLEPVLGDCGGALIEAPIRLAAALDPARDLNPESPRLRTALDALRAAAFAVSDRLSLQVFSHGNAERLSAVNA
ncbi:MAG TPA: circularly permuted type 2 ATP-grasp protein [Quisquiliibacterium sp.]|nr:circularly permuted type 2 ATP-grasp protein [Quisquiliibacterium sp.]HQD82907.1 circularly permuted type 2 ATP-grasp protein [Quisquiliibacterium sp.]HQP65282.1 circularly permuted type 2 ATP-grasp protein [Quisquiliibacterium sp.]